MISKLSQRTTSCGSSGAVTDSYRYDAFGKLLSHGGPSAQRYRFTGEQQDPEVLRDLYYLRARYYDPSLGRFWTKDPLSGSVGRPQTQNAYAYGVNNPVMFRDPYGLCGLCDWVGDNVVDPIEDNIVEPAVDYLSDPANLANAVQTVGSLGMVVSCGGQSAIVPIGYVCAGSVLLYVGGTGAKVYLADSWYAKGCHAAAGGVGFVPLEGFRGKVVAFLTGTTDEFCEPAPVQAAVPSNATPGKE